MSRWLVALALGNDWPMTSNAGNDNTIVSAAMHLEIVICWRGGTHNVDDRD
jgi:hypothetical protein